MVLTDVHESLKILRFKNKFDEVYYDVPIVPIMTENYCSKVNRMILLILEGLFSLESLS